jgi:hypothetical protein
MQNLETVFKSIRRGEINENKNWYKKANLYAQYLSNEFMVDFNKVCAVISALSPACNWVQNKKDAKAMIVCYVHDLDYADFNFSTYGANVAKVWNILNYKGNDLLNKFFSLKTGAKTFNFYLNILNPKNENFVTIDRHAISIYHGSKRFRGKKITQKQYSIIANAYINTAKSLNLLPCEFQAILWSNHVKNILN